MKISYNWLKEYVTDLPEAEKLTDIFTYKLCEVESVQHSVFNNDTIFDLKILPDRAHDLLSHRGVARELSALLNLKFKNQNEVSLRSDLGLQKGSIQIEIQTDKCRRYMGRIVRNVKVGPSPKWLKNRLESIEQRSINNIVDIANFVLFDLGQPVHIFDLDKITDQHGLKNGLTPIIIREAIEGEEIATLDNKKVRLNKDDLIISVNQCESELDQSKSVPLAIAGVKGGIKTEVDENTKNILIEVANFDPVSIRKTAHKINIHTDAVKRFENNLSPELASVAMDAVTDLICQINTDTPDSALGTIWLEETVDIYPNKQKEKIISFDANFINKKLGANIKTEEIKDILKRYKYKYSTAGDRFEITVPTLRLDIETSNDMVEEIGRVYGYDKIEAKKPEINSVRDRDGLQRPSAPNGINETFYKMLWARKNLILDGYKEVMTYTFREKGDLEVLESASDKKFLRTNLFDGLKESYELNKKNAPLLGFDEIKIFEIGSVFSKKFSQGRTSGHGEEIHVAYTDKKGITETSLEDFCKDIQIGDSYDDLLNTHYSLFTTHFKPWSKYPFISRDIAVWLLEKESKENLEKILLENSTDLLVVGPTIFDKFSKGDKISYAYRMVFQSMERTLKDEEVNKIMEKIYNNIKEKDWEIR